MHFIFLSLLFVSIFVIFPINEVFGRILLDDAMTKQEQQSSGVDQLNYSQKMALEKWLNENFDVKEGKLQKKQEQLYLSLNIDNGSKLELSDRSVYEIDPEDQIYSAFWITPFPVEVSQSDNPDYPFKITNLNTRTSVNGRQITEKQLLQEEREKQMQKKQEQAPAKPSPEQKQPVPPPQKKKPLASLPFDQGYINR